MSTNVRTIGQPSASNYFGAVSIIDPATGLPLSATGGYASSATFTPTAVSYTAGNTMGTAGTFASIAPAGGGSVLITNTRLRVDANAVQSGETSYTLQLYTVTPPSALANNTAWNLPSGDRASYVGSIALGTVVDLGDTLWVEQTGLTKQIIVPAVAVGSLWGYLVTNGTFTATVASRVVTLTSMPS
jgi:hypothetical protein